MRRDAEHQPISVKELALGLPKRAWRTIAWREGSAEPLSSRFARVRVRAARRDFTCSESRPEEWLLIEWPEDEAGADQILALDPSRRHAFHAWSISPNCAGGSSAITRSSNRKSASGTIEGRGWRGFHHHATLCIAAYAFLIAERGTISPSGSRPAMPFKNLPFPKATDPEALPLRTQRHVPNSIATTRQRLIVALAKRLPRCPCCAMKTQINRHL